MQDVTLNDPQDKDFDESEYFSKMSSAISTGDFTEIASLAGKGGENEEKPVVDASPGEPENTGEVLDPDKDGTGAIAEDTPQPAAAEAPDGDDNEVKKLKDELEKAKQREQALRYAGMVPPLQSKINKLENELRELKSRSSSAPVKANTPQHTIENKRYKNKLAQIKESDPLLAEILEEALSEEIQGLRSEFNNRFEETNQRFTDTEERDILSKEWDRLVHLVPQAPNVFQLPQWAEWKDSQSPGIKQLAGSMYADDVVIAIEKFARDIAAQNPGLAQASAPTPTDNSNGTQNQTLATAEVAAKATKVQLEREGKLKTAAPSSSKAPAQGDIEPNDPDALYSYFYKKIVKDNHLDRKR